MTDIASDPRWAELRDLALAHGLRACWSKPVLARSGEVLGTFALYYDEPRAPTPDDIARIDASGHLAALAIERQRTDEALRESEEHYRHSVELNPQIPWIADPQGNILDVSSRWSDLTGMPVAEARGQGWIRALHPDDVGPMQSRWTEALASGEPADAEYRVRLADGSYRWFRARCAARRADDGCVIRWYGTIEDIHDRKLAEEALRESEEHYRYSVELNPQISWTTTPEGQVIEIGPRWLVLTGMTREEILAPNGWTKVIHPGDLPELAEAWSQALSSGEPLDHEFRLRLADGSYRWFRARGAARRDETGRIIRWYGTDEDIHDRKMAEETLRWAAYHDDLTDLPNRRFFRERLQQTLDHAVAAQRRVGLLVMDLDAFKQVNDRFGQQAGDALLKEFAARLQGIVRASDTVARLGGDEFAVILADVKHRDDVAAAAQAVLAQMKASVSGNDHLRECRTSIGGAISVGPGMTAEKLLKQAHLALSRSKLAGGGTFKMFEPAMREEAQKTASALVVAGKAVAFDWIVPFYQPKVALGSGRLAGFEALLRWHHPRTGIQSPGAIAPAFNDTELGIAIGERMLSCVIRDMRGWREAGLEVGRIAINASAAEFRRDDYAERVLERLRQAGVPARCLEVEITEGVFLGSGAEAVERALRALSAAGVTIALDDFGTGFASLSHLKRFPVDVIKIDRSFVADMEADAGNTAIINGVIGLGRSLGIEVVAEGVENATQVALLHRQGCDRVQGFHFGRPMPAEDVPPLVTSWAGGLTGYGAS